MKQDPWAEPYYFDKFSEDRPARGWEHLCSSRRPAEDNPPVMTLPLMGRDAEISALNELVDGLEQRGAAIVVRGEAGIGKSALVEALGRTALARGMVVLRTTGVLSEANLPFAGLHELLHSRTSDLDTLPAPQRAALEAAFGMTDIAAPDLFLI